MTRRAISMLTLIGVAGALAAGCGSGDEGEPIPRSITQELEVQLDEAEARLDNGSAGACQDITNDTEPEVMRILDRVPEDVDPDARDALNEGFARLFELVSERCDELESETPPTTETTPPETTETTPPETTETTPPETTETTPPETTPDQPTTPEPGDGQGDDNGGSGLPVPGDQDGGAVTPPGGEG